MLPTNEKMFFFHILLLFYKEVVPAVFLVFLETTSTRFRPTKALELILQLELSKQVATR